MPTDTLDPVLYLCIYGIRFWTERMQYVSTSSVLNRLVQFNVIRRYVKTNSSPYYS